MSRYTFREEKANTLTHAIGIPFGLSIFFLLLQKTIPTGNYWHIISVLIYATFMTFSYFTSTFYHADKNERRKLTLRKFDHAAIYLHIAGSYTPFTLVVLRQHGAWGWTLFAIIWIAAIAGVLLSFMKLKNASKLETACYVAMGWVVVVAFKPLIDALSASGSMDVFWWLLAGGLFYTVGAGIYSLKKIEFMHAVWHLFVLGGSICHAYAIWLID
ncbi:MAG: hemolysin III family protein [Paludibacter sp.]|nr:hemolysin III family protein [Paludibacter sp.]